MHQSIKILVGALFTLGLAITIPKEDPYGRFLRSYAKHFKARLMSEKFDVAQNYKFGNLKKHGLVKWPCISHEDLSVSDYTIPLGQIEIDSLGAIASKDKQ